MLVERCAYDAFGRPTIRDANSTEIAESALANPYLFTGRAWDPETALYYYRARYYDYFTGRFLQPDPTGYADGLNLYSYCGNNPVGFVDPIGLCKEQAFSWWDNLKISMGSAIGDAIGQWYEASGGEETADYYWEGRHVGTQYGEQAADWYARKYLEATTSYGKAGYYTLGLFASLWTPESWKKTASVIVAAGSAAEPASKAKPWLGTAGFHPPHHGMGRHLEVIIRVGAHKVLKIFIPGAKQAIKFIIQ